ncbi:hypothetical protein ES703_17028 [subsurface metagenome]
MVFGFTSLRATPPLVTTDHLNPDCQGDGSFDRILNKNKYLIHIILYNIILEQFNINPRQIFNISCIIDLLIYQLN